ncbi:hypothetical protein CHARACLAT_029378 [Characodon lateralis]|uniref:Uncharacterized protein n=1 Tax=Characodon lateralis TaxID=208331 RepID=A0ABU7CVA9_9TELE|nr:hypothetical protein [Characodon lateralis]
MESLCERQFLTLVTSSLCLMLCFSASNIFSFSFALCVAQFIFPPTPTVSPSVLKRTSPQHDAATTMYHSGDGVFRVMHSVKFSSICGTLHAGQEAIACTGFYLGASG